MTPVNYFLGVDGGGTGCRARLRNRDGRILGESNGGPGNIRLGLDLVWGNISAAIEQVFATAGLGISAKAETAIALGLAGVLSTADSERVASHDHDFASITVVSDAQIACIGAFSGRDGAILISGTGCAAYAWLGDVGTPMFGWGFDIDDRGSAADMGRKSVRAAIDAFDGLGEKSPFTDEILAALGGTQASVVTWVSDAVPHSFGRLAPIAMHHARLGDAAAQVVVARVVADIEVRLRRLNQMGAERISLMGGLAEQIVPLLSSAVTPLLAVPEKDAADGAIFLARRTVEKQQMFTEKLK